ncbi:LamG domain-containing protein [Streptomyces sp. TRM 70361]|uniref:LamG domain-containing protein n=1 Tax=Streptomyces sp. TRM 70361 TaxID=3116553 RepID=UPI002E7BE291|nr:LamG domain-containing protein [Streptomyces sp. TRM 70361]MEE1941155.1 LamG domain-containing protein [Streptomyces sp. TRM 70361]
MTAGLLSAPSAQADARTEEPPAPTEGQRALAEAEKTGERVEVTGERSEHSTVFANPDGHTFTLEESSVPVRVAGPGGGWQTPDPTLEVRPDGSVGPKATAAEMTFSGGGDDPLVRIAEQGRSLELDWPDSLPEPELNGTSALYREVLPDVDLRVTASTEGFRHVLVVKTPQAAAGPELKRIDYRLKAAGLSLREGAAGSLTAVDGDGRTVFRAPPAQMWDSAGEDAEQQATVQQAPRLTTGTAKTSERTETGDSPGAEAEPEPEPGDTVTRMEVEVTEDTLTVVPDAGMLTDTDASAYPLHIDPSVTLNESERTLLRSDGYESYGWGNGSDGRGKGAGKCGTWSGYYCGPGYVQRLYFEFSPAKLKGKNILDVTFRVTEPWAFQCDPRWVNLVRTNNISSATTWSSRPKELDLMVDRHVSAGRGSLCDPDSPDAPIEFRDNQEESNENLTPTVRNFAAGKFSRLTLQIRAKDESDTSAWKRFKNDAVLAVKYVARPALPKNVGLLSGNGTVCSTSEADPDVISDPTPAVTGRPRTAAGGEAGANLRIRWRTDHWDGSSWVRAHTDVDSPTSGYAGNLAVQTRSLPALSEGVKYRLRALTMSYYENGSNRLNTGYTTACHFKVDPTAPKAPEVTIGSPYTECTVNECGSGGGPGKKGTFTFAPADGDTNNVSYDYRLSSQTTWSTASGSKASVAVTPQKAGTHRLYVRARDTIGRLGAQNVVDFLVAAGEGPVGRWHFDEADGVAKDSAAEGGARHDAALHGGAVRDDRGRRGLVTHDGDGAPLDTPVTDKGLALDGSGGYAATGGPVLETRSAYTVSAWVRLQNTDSSAIVASQDGARYSPFVLNYSKDSDRWFFGVKEKDEATGTAYYGIRSKQKPSTGVWTHLAGTYDPTSQDLSLYVNGKRQGTTSAPGSWSSTGAFQIGRYKWANVHQYYFPGSIDEVTAWQRALTPEEIADEARLKISEGHAAVELVAHWDPSTGSGTTVADTVSGYGRELKLTGGASLDGEAIVLDGVDGAATATGPLVDDTGSFTVTTAVEVDSAKILAKDAGYTGQVLGQRTSDGSAWGLWYELTGKRTVYDPETDTDRTEASGRWHFGRMNADGTFSSVVSEETAELDSAVRLTGVFDAQAGTISLYVGHLQNGDAQMFTAQTGSGDFAVGRGFTSGQWKHHLPARVAEVRLWAGAMTGSEQIEDRVGG